MQPMGPGKQREEKEQRVVVQTCPQGKKKKKKPGSQKSLISIFYPVPRVS